MVREETDGERGVWGEVGEETSVREEAELPETGAMVIVGLLRIGEDGSRGC